VRYERTGNARFRPIKKYLLMQTIFINRFYYSPLGAGGITVKVFGQLTDVVGNDIINVDDIADTDSLIKTLQSKYPVLISSKYRVAVNRNIVQSNTPVQQDAEVALLPPFSGG